MQDAAGGEEAATTGTMTRGVLVAGVAVKEEVDMVRRVLVAEAVTVEVEVVAQATTEGSRGSGTPGEMMKAAIVRVAREPRAEAENRLYDGQQRLWSWSRGVDGGSPRRHRRSSTSNGLGCNRSNNHGGGAGNG